MPWKSGMRSNWPFTGMTGAFIPCSSNTAPVQAPAAIKTRPARASPPGKGSPQTGSTPVYAVQVGAFRDRGRAERLRAEMAARYGVARLVERTEDPGVWRVMVGAEATVDAAGALSARVRRESGEKNVFVVRLDSK